MVLANLFENNERQQVVMMQHFRVGKMTVFKGIIKD